MMLGLLLSRAGVEVTVLEKHGDFLRDFRGDTAHASTIRLLDELGLGEDFRKLPQSRLGNLEVTAPGGGTVLLGDFGTLPGPTTTLRWFRSGTSSTSSRRPPSGSPRSRCG